MSTDTAQIEDCDHRNSHPLRVSMKNAINITRSVTVDSNNKVNTNNENKTIENLSPIKVSPAKSSQSDQNSSTQSPEEQKQLIQEEDDVVIVIQEVLCLISAYLNFIHKTYKIHKG